MQQAHSGAATLEAEFIIAEAFAPSAVPEAPPNPYTPRTPLPVDAQLPSYFLGLTILTDEELQRINVETAAMRSSSRCIYWQALGLPIASGHTVMKALGYSGKGPHGQSILQAATEFINWWDHTDDSAIDPYFEMPKREALGYGIQLILEPRHDSNSNS
jgi:hypothetical protein